MKSRLSRTHRAHTPKIIGLAGHQGVGKSTLAALMIAAGEPGEIEVLHLADPLKEACAEAFGVPLNYFHDRQFKESTLPEGLGMVTEHAIDMIEDYFSVACPGLQFSKGFRKKWVGTVLNTPREIAQKVGTEWLRTFDPDIHAKILQAKAEEAGSRGVKIVLVPDVRFPNEIYAVDQLLYLKRKGVEGKTGQHESENHHTTLIASAAEVELPEDLSDVQELARDFISKVKAQRLK